jgi:hypothetical protein
MRKKIVIIILMLIALFSILWVLGIRPFVHGLKNDTDHSKLLFSFETIEHPTNTKQLYFVDFFGNSSGSSNHCEHIFLEIRTYTSGTEMIIRDYYKRTYPYVELSFITSLEQCCHFEGKHYIFCDFVSAVTKDQPVITADNWQNQLSIYTIEFTPNGKYTADVRCF